MVVFWEWPQGASMQTTQHTSGHAIGFTARLILNIRGLFGAPTDGDNTLAASCAADIQRATGLASWVESLGQLDQRERRGMLLRAAGTFSGEFAATDLANALSCMATDAGLFLAVTDALKSVKPRPASIARAA
jgi:hypothetical protein